jgi:hypothetical protein
MRALGIDPADVLPVKGNAGTAVLDSLAPIGEPTPAWLPEACLYRRPARWTRLHLQGRRLECLPLERIRHLHSSLQEAGRVAQMRSPLLVLIRLM